MRYEMNWMALLLLLHLGDLRAKSVDTPFYLAPVAAPPVALSIAMEITGTKPVLTRGASGQWDSVDVMNPSVIRFKGVLYNYYSGFDGHVWRTGLATSSDGIVWEKSKENPILSPDSTSWDTSYIAANGAAIYWKNQIFYFYQGVDRNKRTHVGLATSNDGIHFKKHPSPVLTAGSAHSWEGQAVADPYVIAKDGFLYLYYLGQDEAMTQRLGVARSMDGITWQRSPANPILDVGAYESFDHHGLGEPSVAFSAPYFYLIYTGRDKNEARNLGYALSLDGIHWKKMSSKGLLAPGQLAPWTSKVICDSTLLEDTPGKWRFWFGGGDKPEAAENLNGQIGIGSLDLTQGLDPSAFDANFDWQKSAIRSVDLLRGSFAPEGAPGGRWVWIGPQAETNLVVGPNERGKLLTIQGRAPFDAVWKAWNPTQKITLKLLVNGKVMTSQQFDRDKQFTMSVPWNDIANLLGSSNVVTVQLRADRSFVPAQLGLGPDTRQLAVMINSIRFESQVR